MKFSASEIRALEAAIDQFDDMIGGGSEDPSHETHHTLLAGILKKVKQHNRNKYVLVTKHEFEAMSEEVESAHSQSGAMDDEPAKCVATAYKAMKAVEKRNAIRSCN
jgi:hypothetical protein